MGRDYQQIFGRNNIQEKVDHRSYRRQGIEQIPTIHLGVSASQMEKKGIATDRGNINRGIKHQNMILREISRRIKAFTKLDKKFNKKIKIMILQKTNRTIWLYNPPSYQNKMI